MWVDPAELVEWDRNPRKITPEAVEKVAGSIQRFGFAAPIVAQRGTNRVLAGHTRLRAARQLGLDEVPVRFMDVTDADATAYALADNRLGELVEWDEQELDTLLGELEADGLDLSDLGWDGALDSDPAGRAPAPDPEPVHSGPADSVVGRVYHLGPHRLVCGDSSLDETWALLDGEYDLVWTDPPYGVAYESRGRAISGGKQHDPIEHDNASVEDLAVLLRRVLGRAYERTRSGGVWYVAAPTGAHRHAFGLVLTSLPTVWRHEIVWRKDRMVIGRCDRHYSHESLFYGWKDGAGHTWTGGRQRTSVIDCPRPRVSAEHPTMKPVELVEECLGCHREGRPERVLDPFGGSGTTLLASARLGMVADLIELSPHYCDVIRRRWGAYAAGAGIDAGPDSL